MNYISAAEAAEKWDLGLRQVQRLLASGRIPGVKKHGRSWLLPADSEKPCDLRIVKQSQAKSLWHDLEQIFSATIIPWPAKDPGAVLKSLSNDFLCLQIEAEFSYLRGDFRQVINCYRRTDGNEAAKLRASSITIGAAISLGDYPLYLELERFLNDIIRKYRDTRLTAYAELSLATASTGAVAPKMTPDWLISGDFTQLHPLTKPDAIYKRAKHYQCLRKYEVMLGIAETALCFNNQTDKISFQDIYFRLCSAAALCTLGQYDQAKHRLQELMKVTLPHGFITPLVESASVFGGLLEQCLKTHYPQYYRPIRAQWEESFANWLSFHNHFTRDKITLILSLRNYELASLAARGVPYAKIADQYNISVGHLQNIMHDIFTSLMITKKSELSRYIL